MKRPIPISFMIIFGVVIGFTYFRTDQSIAPSRQAKPASPTPSTSDQPNQPVSFDKTRFSTKQADSLWVIVNKSNPLEPKDYVPSDLILPDVAQRIPGVEEMKLRKVAAKSLEHMFADAKRIGHNLLVSTAYRGYAYQKTLYTGYVASEGQAGADRISARPGYSEHQTGLAVDIRVTSGKCSLDQCFGDLAAGQWLARNAHKYGFMLRYPEDKEQITGYTYEPWHFRYVGTKLSNHLHETGTATLEKFFNVSGGTEYR